MIKRILFYFGLSLLFLLTIGCGAKEKNVTNVDTNISAKENNNSFAKTIEKVKLVSQYTNNDYLEGFESVEFGSYLQNENEPTPIEWVVLDRVNGEALLISKYVLDHKKYNEMPSEENITWETSTLRQWLNNEFYNTAFNDEEKLKVCQKLIPAEDGVDGYFNSKGNYVEVKDIVNGGNDTNDYVFLLSANERKKYAKYNAGCTSKPTEYAKNVDINGNKIRIYNIGTKEGTCGYWLRSPAGYKNYIETVNYNGGSGEGGQKINTVGLGVRPVIWVKYK